MIYYYTNDQTKPFNFFLTKLIVSRRKPQNLTPPLSSDGGSSTSGQSPTSTHNGSPPPAVKRPPTNSDKYSDPANHKKQRISHFRNHDTTICTSPPAKNENHRSTNHRRIGSGASDSRDSSALSSSRSRTTSGVSTNSGNGSGSEHNPKLMVNGTGISVDNNHHNSNHHDNYG